jgi:hypothetical protein
MEGNKIGKNKRNGMGLGAGSLSSCHKTGCARKKSHYAAPPVTWTGWEGDGGFGLGFTEEANWLANGLIWGKTMDEEGISLFRLAAAGAR